MCTQFNTYFAICLQDEKSIPPDDFRQVEKSSQLPRKSVVGVKVYSGAMKVYEESG